MTPEQISEVTEWCRRERYEAARFPAPWRQQRLAELDVIEKASDLHCLFAFPDSEPRLNAVFAALARLSAEVRG